MRFKACSTAPMDRATIITSIPLDQNFARQIQEDPSSIPSPWRDLVVDTNSKVARRKDGDVPCLISHLDTYGGIDLRAEMKFGRWYITRIAFNPSKLLYGHNGRILDEEGLLLALSILKALVSRVLENVADAIHVIPGTHSDSIAWWSSVEIPFQQPMSPRWAWPRKRQ